MVVSASEASASVPVFDSWTWRWIVSPGTIFVAPMVRRFVAEPAVPSAMATVPDDTVCEAEVVDVNEPKVPRLATAAAPPIRLKVESTLIRVEIAFMTFPFICAGLSGSSMIGFVGV